MQNLDFRNLDWNKIDSKIPKEDYINSKFDYKNATPINDILVIFSTPRSGSTLLCDLLYKNNICIPHEYFQIDDYLPLLAKGWNCLKDESIDKQLFIDTLIQKRTSPKGWLGLNLHGEHLALFSAFKSLFPEANYHYIHIVRQNSFSQAISYEMAIQTGKWSSHFRSDVIPGYSFKAIKNKLDRIYHQNNLISAYIKMHGIDCQTMFYEDLVSSPKAQLERILPQSYIDHISINSDLKKQSSSLNQEWLGLFAEEYFTKHGVSSTMIPVKDAPKKSIKNIFKSRQNKE